MVDFTLTDEQKNLREMAHDFAVKEIRPVAWEYDKDGTWPQDIIEKAWEVGLMNSHIEEEYGGAGAGYLDGCLIEEELSWGCSGIQTSLGCNGLATAPIALGGSEEIKKKYLGMLTEAPKLASFCLTEPDAGSDVSGMRTTAVKKGDKYVINGSKCFITNGGYADYYTVYAKTDKDAGPPRHLARSSSSATGAWWWTRRRTSSGSAPRTRRRSPSTTSRSPPRTCWARKTRASSSR